MAVSDPTSLDLTRSRLTSISKTTFPNAKQLEIIDLSRNNLERILAQVFSEAKNLLKLLLFVNKIHTIDDNAFDGLSKLNVLNLAYNRLTKITRNMFANLPQLRCLVISDNQIEEIEEGALDFPKLEILDLNNNTLKSFADSLFAHTPALIRLWARHNNLQYVNNALYQLSKVEGLHLGYNKIGDFDLKKLARMKNAKELMMGNNPLGLNSLTVTADDIAASKSNVTQLYLSYAETVNDPVFEKLQIFPNLETVSLSDFSFKNFDLATVRKGGFDKLRRIIISHDNFDREWLNATARNLSMGLERISPQWTQIRVNTIRLN